MTLSLVKCDQTEPKGEFWNYDVNGGGSLSMDSGALDKMPKY